MFFRFLTYFTEAVGDEIIIKLILPVNVPFLLNPWFYVRRLCMYLYIWHRTGSEHKATLFVFFGVSFERPYLITGLTSCMQKPLKSADFITICRFYIWNLQNPWRVSVWIIYSSQEYFTSTTVFSSLNAHQEVTSFNSPGLDSMSFRHQKFSKIALAIEFLFTKSVLG